jgi:hypothetical protein
MLRSVYENNPIWQLVLYGLSDNRVYPANHPEKLVLFGGALALRGFGWRLDVLHC